MPFFFQPIEGELANSLSSIDKKWAKEFYGSSSVFFFKFESVPLVDNISGRRATVDASEGTALPFLEEGAFGKALRLRPLSSIQYGVNLPASLPAFSLGFWLSSVNVSPAVNATTGVLNYYRMGVVDKASFETDSNNVVQANTDDSTFAVYEECRENNKNRMYIHLVTDTGSNIDAVTEEYTAGVFHYFWITFSSDAQTVMIYIDGKPAQLDITTNGWHPLMVNQSIPFHINKSGLGHEALLRGNFGLIDELIFQTEFVVSEDIIGRHINYGSEYAVNNALLLREETHQAFAYDDPTTVDVNSICSNGTNIYAGRSDGRLLKGDRTMWKVRRDFANRDEIRYVKKNIISSDSVVDISNGALRLSKASVRI